MQFSFGFLVEAWVFLEDESEVIIVDWKYIKEFDVRRSFYGHTVLSFDIDFEWLDVLIEVETVNFKLFFREMHDIIAAHILQEAEFAEAADIYGLDRLKQMCENAIMANIDISNSA